MFSCQICGCVFHVNRKLVAHIKLFHVHEPDFRLSCETCARTFTVLSSYTAHKSKYHNLNQQLKNKCMSFHCPHCDHVAYRIGKLMLHYKEHIKTGVSVECPYLNCTRQYTVYSSLTSHTSRCHNYQGAYKEHIVPGGMICNMTENFTRNSDEHDVPTNCNNGSNTEDISQLEKYYGLLLLKLQTKYNIPSSVVQCMITDIQELMDLYGDDLMDNSFSALTEVGKLKYIEKCEFSLLFFTSNFTRVMKVFNSEHKRYKYFEDKFSLVKPNTINLGMNHFNKKCSFQYVPLSASLKQLLKHEDVLSQVMNSRESENGIIADFMDGQFYKSKNNFNNGRVVLHILYFFDEFQVTNPLGSHQKNHKIAGFYYVLGNLFKSSRSSLKVIQLSAVCRSVDLKYFGFGRILDPLIRELQELSATGIEIPNVGTFDCRLCFCSADNLGSHQLGGFSESFSPNVQHICRSCLITSSELQNNFRVEASMLRTPENYDRHADAVENDPSLRKIYGIKCKSPLNQIPGFHVTRGLPPDVMHDLLEGVVPYEICLVLRKLIGENTITLDYLNRRISCMSYDYSDARNKPEMQNLDKGTLVGTASQNWTLLRLLPVLIASRIPENNLTWHFFLQLKLIVEMALSPIFTIGHVDLLQSEIENHLQEFKHLFPQSPLKPKHHYLTHYGKHIINFGPLVTYWCYRFEAKHKILKIIGRQANQYKNVPYTLAFRHQLAQCLYHQSSQGLVKEEVKVTQTENLNVTELEADIQKIVRGKISSDWITKVPKVTIRSTEYRVGNVLIVGFLQGEPTFAKIEMIILNEKDVWFVVQNCDSNFIEHYGTFSISANGYYDCIEHISLTHWNPLSCYRLGSHTHHSGSLNLVILKHMVFDLGDFLDFELTSR